jgi:hypothetical protein
LHKAPRDFSFKGMRGFFLEMAMAAALTAAYVAVALALHHFHLLVPAAG